MSLALQDRGLFSGVLEGLRVSRCRTLGHTGSPGRLQSLFPLSSSFVIYADPPLITAVEDLLAKGAIEPVSLGPGFYSRLFVTPKVTGGWRPVIDLSCLNRFVRLSHFRMESVQSVLQSIRSGDWMISLDLQDAYLQVPVHPEFRKYLRFCLGDKVYQFRVICFGLSSAPQVFTRVIAPSLLHHASFWVPDPSLFRRLVSPWILPSGDRSAEGLPSNSLLGARDSSQSSQDLSHSFSAQDYLGMALQSSPLRVFPTQARVQKVLCLVDEFLSSRVQPLGLWRSLLGVMSSLSTLRLRMRSLQHRLQVSCHQESPTEPVSWDDSCPKDLLWWSDPSHLVVGVDLALPHPELLLFTDASDAGWGASLGSDHLSGLWSRDVSQYSINHRELLAVFLAIRGFLHLLRGKSVSLFTDNTSALSYLRKEGGTRSSTLNSVAQAILRLCESSDVRLLPQFVPGRLSVLADSLSRGGQVLDTEWTLYMDVCLELFRRWPVTVDLFATSLNHRL